jgi:hypothetical protein
VRNTYLEAGRDLSRRARVIHCLNVARDSGDPASVRTARAITAS